jgi:uncharacterized protein involved in exopolysaccharide biosynthesis
VSIRTRLDSVRSFVAGRPELYLPPLLGLLLSVAYSVLTPEAYTSSAVIMPVSESQTIGGQSRAPGGLLGFGLLGGGFSGGDTQRYIQILKSRRVGEQFIDDAGLLRVLFAHRWDAEADDWAPLGPSMFGLIPADPTADPEPTLWRAFNLLEAIRTIQLDEMSGTLRVSFTFDDPVTAKELTEDFIAFANQYIREIDSAAVDRNLEFLMSKLDDTSSPVLKQAASAVAESQLKRRMFIEAREEYAFEVVDHPVIPEEPSQPSRLLALVMGVAGGMLAGVFLTLLRDTLPKGD